MAMNLIKKTLIDGRVPVTAENAAAYVKLNTVGLGKRP
jgi:hypothetical protein